MSTDEAFSKLLQIAADLARGMNLPSAFAEDYQRHSYSAARVAAMMVKPTESQRNMAVEIRKCVDVIRAEVTARPVKESPDE